MKDRYLGDWNCQFQTIRPEASLYILCLSVWSEQPIQPSMWSVSQYSVIWGHAREKNDLLTKVYYHICRQIYISTMHISCFYIFA